MDDDVAQFFKKKAANKKKKKTGYSIDLIEKRMRETSLRQVHVAC